MALAFQADITRVFTFMMARELSQRSYPQVGVPDPHHATSHHQDDPEETGEAGEDPELSPDAVRQFPEQAAIHSRWRRQLLDHTMLLYGSYLSNSNIHNHFPLPTLAGGRWRRHAEGRTPFEYPENTPMSNLLLSVLNKIGVPTDKVGDSTSGSGGRLGESKCAFVLAGRCSPPRRLARLGSTSPSPMSP